MSPLSPSGRQSLREPLCRKRLGFLTNGESFRSANINPPSFFRSAVATGYSVVGSARADDTNASCAPPLYWVFRRAAPTHSFNRLLKAERLLLADGADGQAVVAKCHIDLRLEMDAQRPRSFRPNRELSSLRLRQGYPALRDSLACIRPDGGM